MAGFRRRRAGAHGIAGDLLGGTFWDVGGPLWHALDDQLPEETVSTSEFSGGIRTMPKYYVDGFVLAVPRKNLKAYRAMALKASKVWRDHGALEVVECVADDVKKGKWTSFPQSVKLKKNEVVVFSWITYKSRKDRDRILAK